MPEIRDEEQPKNRSRRRFLKTIGVVGGGLIVAIPFLREGEKPYPHLVQNAFTPNAFLQITPSNEVHFYVPSTEMGQGVIHGLSTLIAEELDLDPELIKRHHAGVHEDFNNPGMGMQITGGSMSMAMFFRPLRQAAANTREILRAAAAQSLGVDGNTLELSDGWVRGAGDPRPWGDFANLADTLSLAEPATLKSAENFRFIGQERPRLDALSKSTGTAEFGMDIDFPGLKRAVVRHCPVLGGSVKNLDPTRALEMPGVLDVFAIDQGVAVVAESFWQAKQAAEAVDAEWDLPELAQHSSDSLDQALRAALDSDEKEEALSIGEPVEVMKTASKQVEAEYSVPYLAHATMEPMNCTVRLDGEHCEIWAPNQGPQVVQGIAAFEMGLARDNVIVHSTFMGGGFGRRSYPDFVVEALQIAKISGHPIQLVWTREDDMRNDFYRPAARARFSAGLDTEGNIKAWRVTRAGPNILNYSLQEAAGALAPPIIPDGIVRWAGRRAHGLFNSMTVDPTSVEGMFSDYEIANADIQHVTVDPGLRTGFWRAVGHSISGFFKETFMDELAIAAGRDPLQFRLDHLAPNSPLAPLLETVARASNWGNPTPGRFQGLALHTSFGTAVAEVAEVSIENDTIRVHRVYCAVDCGLAVNPGIVAAQMESGIVYGLTAALYGRIDLDNGVVRQGNFHDYPALRIPDAPRVDVHIMPSDAAPTGVGEPGLPPLAAAVGNAVFAATGQRLRSLPFDLG